MRRFVPWALLLAVAGAVLVGGAVGATNQSVTKGNGSNPTRPSVPSLVGLPIAKAEAEISKLGDADSQYIEVPSTARVGTVIGQRTLTSVGSLFFMLRVAMHDRATTRRPLRSCVVGAPFSQPQSQPSEVAVDLGRTSGAWDAYGYPGLVAPSGWLCSGFIAQDGGNTFVAVPPGEQPPGVRNGLAPSPPTAQISTWGEPACGSCRWAITCSLFPATTHWYPGPCPQPVPSQEIDRTVGRGVVDFIDPPHVAGTGRPSGGALPAMGVVINDGGAAMLTCVLPASEKSVCKTAIRAFTNYELGLTDPGGVLAEVNVVVHGS